LDRAVANISWHHMHPSAVVQNLDYAKSDHRPIMIDTDYQVPPTSHRTKFKRFEAKWFSESGFSDVVLRAWDSAVLANPGGSVLDKLGHMHGARHAWDAATLKKPKKASSQGSTRA
jgi:hypothetical protein